MALREIEPTLPPGFRFYPSDEELVCHYLRKKVANERIAQGTLVEVDLHAREPWELPEVSKLTASEWYFFSFRDRKYATGSRTNRATKTGYWKATGKDREVRSATTRAVVGMRKTLVFYKGRAPNGTKSSWVMHEFRLDTPHSPPREDWVLCRVFQKMKADGDGQDGAGNTSPPSFASSPHVSGGYYRPCFAPQQEVITTSTALLPLYGTTPVDQQGFMQDAGGAAPPGFAFAPMRGAARDDYGFGYFEMGGFHDVASLEGPMMGFPQEWDV